MSTQLRDLTVADVCTRLNLPDEAQSAFTRGWEESAGAMPRELPTFLTRDYVAASCRSIGFNEEATKLLGKTARIIAEDPVMTRLAWHLYWLAFKSGFSTGDMPRVPSLVTSDNVPGHQFYAVIALGGLPTALQSHQRLNVPESISQSTLKDIWNVVSIYKQNHGQYGMTEASFNYFHRLFHGELFQIERLQFHFNPFRSEVRVFRRLRDGQVIALAEAGVRYRADGERYVASRGDRVEETWRSSLFETPREVSGYLVSPRGKAERSKVTLRKDEWDCVLRDGDSVLQIHIPGGSAMDFDACGRAMEGALRFFDQYFPERSYKAFACNSWLLDDQLEDMLPADSNLVRFLREFYRFPTGGTTRSALYWVFGTVPEDLAKAPRDSTLRKRIIDHILNGGSMVGGGGFILREDLDWGSQVYRRQDLEHIRGSS